MKYPFPVAALILLILFGKAPARACGPFLNEGILDLGFAILRAPTTSFELELARIQLEPGTLPGRLELPEKIQPHYANHQLTEGWAKLLFETSGEDLIADRDGCRTNLAATNVDLARDVAEVAGFLKKGTDVEEYRALRLVMVPGKNWARHFVNPAMLQQMENRVKKRDWPKFLPEEFRLYLDGATDFSAQNWDAASASFEKLLALPLEQRRYRSTWAAYMRARVELKKGDPDLQNGVIHFYRVLDAREDGCHDSLGLGWDALRSVGDHKLLMGQTGTALRYRFAVAWMGRGPVPPMLQLRWWLRDHKGTELAMNASRDDAFVRQLFTGFEIGTVNAVEYWEDDVTAESSQWLDYLHSVKMTPPEAGSAAHFAYLLGDLNSTAEFLKIAPETDPTAIWLRSKLMAKAGQFRSASREIAKVGNQPNYTRTLEGEIYQFNDQRKANDAEEHRRGQLWGEQGILHLANDRYEEAMEAFVKSGHWRDAAYVAEQLLSREELLTYVRDLWPSYESAAASPNPKFATALCYLTARRLARDQYFKDARGFLPPKLLPVFDKYVENYRRFRNEAKPEPERASAGWEAAQIHRRLGMELFGTEVGPDYTCWDGMFGGWNNVELERLKFMNDKRVASHCSHYRNPVVPVESEVKEWELRTIQIALSQKVFPEPTSSEKWRWKRYALLPNNYRFHYRHVAADLAWEASLLMPIESDETAKVLNVAGSWIATSYPRSADVFYKAMIRRNRSTPTARLADERRWFVSHDWWKTYDPWKSMWMAAPEFDSFYDRPN